MLMTKAIGPFSAGLQPPPQAVTVDFLIPPSDETDQGNLIRHIESDLAAIITPGLELAF